MVNYHMGRQGIEFLTSGVSDLNLVSSDMYYAVGNV